MINRDSRHEKKSLVERDRRSIRVLRRGVRGLRDGRSAYEILTLGRTGDFVGAMEWSSKFRVSHILSNLDQPEVDVGGCLGRTRDRMVRSRAPRETDQRSRAACLRGAGVPQVSALALGVAEPPSDVRPRGYSSPPTSLGKRRCPSNTVKTSTCSSVTR